MPGDEVALSVQGVFKGYPPPMESVGVLIRQMLGERRALHPVLENVSFDVKKGTTVGIVGANGSGKTTLLKIVGGVLAPSAGAVERNGGVASIFRLDVGVQPNLTGAANALTIARLRGIDDSRARALLPEIAGFAELGKFFDRPVRTYSAGMQARLAFAAITADAPEILIVDEALAVGDVRFAQKCNQRFADLRRSGRTILLVSHDMAQVHATCDRVLWLDSGRVLHDGPPAQAIRHYRAHVEAKARTQAEQAASHFAGVHDPRLALSFHEDETAAETCFLRDAGRLIVRLEGSAVVERRRARILIENTWGIPLLASEGEAQGRRLELVLEPLVLARGRHRVTATIDDIMVRRELLVEWSTDEVRTPKLARAPARWTARARTAEAP